MNDSGTMRGVIFVLVRLCLNSLLLLEAHKKIKVVTVITIHTYRGDKIALYLPLSETFPRKTPMAIAEPLSPSTLLI